MLSVVLSVLVTVPVDALAGGRSAGAYDRPVTVVDVGGWGSGVLMLGMSERGHVVVDEQLPPEGGDPPRWHTVR